MAVAKVVLKIIFFHVRGVLLSVARKKEGLNELFNTSAAWFRFGRPDVRLG
jgi:hypothetical protein